MNDHLKQFDIARQLYPGSKVGNANEFKNFVYRASYPNRPKCKYDVKEVLPLLVPSIKRQIQWRKEAKAGEFRPPWKNFQTWVNDNYWEFEPPLVAVLHDPKTCCVCGEPSTSMVGNKRYCPKDNPYKSVVKFDAKAFMKHNRSPANPVTPEEVSIEAQDAGDKLMGAGRVASPPILNPESARERESAAGFAEKYKL